MTVEQVVDINRPALKPHISASASLEMAFLEFAKTQWGKYDARGARLVPPHDRHKSDAGRRVESGLSTEARLNGDLSVESVIVISAGHRIIRSTCCGIRRTPSGSCTPICWRKSVTMLRVGTLAESVAISTGANHLHFAISLLGCAAR